MKRSPALSILLVCAFAMLAAGCVSARRPTTAFRGKPRTIALSVTVDGALQPTPAQFAAIQAQAVRQFGSLGYVLVTDLSLAEAIARINFVPNPNDPENSGRATLLGFRSNPYYALAAPTYHTGRYPSAFGFAGGFSGNGWNALNQYGYGYYGYGSSYYDGYSYSSHTLNPVQPRKPTHPPHRHDPAYCAPDTPRVQPAFSRFLASNDSHTASTHPQSYASRRRDNDGGYASSSSWFGSRSSSSSSSDYHTSYSRSESSYQRSDSASSSAPSYASSYSAPAPSYSAADSSFSSSSSAASSSSSSGSSGSSGTHDATTAHPH